MMEFYNTGVKLEDDLIFVLILQLIKNQGRNSQIRPCTVKWSVQKCNAGYSKSWCTGAFCVCSNRFVFTL
jgi:hypothetical protein